MSQNKQADHAAQGQAEADRTMSPRLLKRLGEAAMGTPRSFGDQYWICRYVPDPKYDIDGPFRTKTDAEAAINGREGFGCFGPYRPESGQGLGGHLQLASMSVEAVFVKVQGMQDPIEIGDEFDAIFWSPAAIEKFVFPYYCGAEGLDYTVAVRDEYVAKDAYLMAHSDDTEYTLWGATGRQGLAPLFEPLRSSR